ncbi:MAG: hypothetical protein ACYC1B_07580 [Thermoleophilia bacterium]
MDNTTSFLHVLHIVAAMTMAWPYYALAAVNQRVKLGPPLGDRTDRYMENILKNRTNACFVFQFTILIGGFLLMWSRVRAGHFAADDFTSNWIISAKILILLMMMAMLTWVRFVVQPEVDRLFGDFTDISDEAKARIGALRLRRKQMSTGCMFAGFAAAMLGVQTYDRFPAWLTVVLLAVLALWAYRSYKSETTFGWV